MADNGRYYWLKLKRDFFKRHDIRIIESMPNGKDYILFYLKLLCESIDHEGRLRFSEQIPYNEEMFAALTYTNVDIVRSAIKIFVELDMMEIMDDGTFFMNEVAKLTGSETAWAEKKRNQKKLPKLNNGSTRLNAEMLMLPDGTKHFVDEKRYGGNGMLALDLSGGKCEMCGSSEKLVIHHNNGYSNDIEDLFVLCTECHGRVHRGGGNFPPLVHHRGRTFLPEKEIEIEKDIDNNIYVHTRMQNEVVYDANEVQIDDNGTDDAQGAMVQMVQMNTDAPKAQSAKRKSDAPYNDRFEELWKIYPRKKNKGKAYACYKARLNSGWSEDELFRATEEYAKECRREHTEERYIKLASTFFSSYAPFVDYLPKDEKEEKVEDKPKEFVYTGGRTGKVIQIGI